MRKIDKILLIVEYVVSVIATATSSTQAVTNPDFSDYLVGGFGMLVGAFLITSIFTLPIQMARGWNKQDYVSKTIRGLPIIIIISLLSRFK